MTTNNISLLLRIYFTRKYNFYYCFINIAIPVFTVSERYDSALRTIDFQY